MSDKHDSDHELPEMERLNEEKPSTLGRWANNTQQAIADPSAKSTIRVLITVGVIAIVASFLVGGSDDQGQERRSVTARPLGQIELAKQSMFTPEDESRIIAENEQARLDALARERGYTPFRMPLLNYSQPNENIPATEQAWGVCQQVVEEGIKAGMDPSGILDEAVRATVQMARSRNMTEEDIISLSTQCAEFAADALNLSNEERIASASRAAQQTAAALGWTKEEQIAAAARAAQTAAAELGLSEDEQIQAAARAAQQAAAKLGYSEEEQVAAAAQAAQQASARLGQTQEEQISAAARAAQQAAADLNWSEEEQVMAAARAARQAAADLNLSEQEQVDAAARAAQQAAAALGWSEEQQVAAAARAAQQAAADLGWDEEAQIAAAARAAQQAAADLGWSKEDQIAAAARAAQAAAASLGWSEQDQVDIAAKIAAETAKRLGLNDDEQIAAGARAAASAAKALGWSKEEQVMAAAKAAHDLAIELGLEPEQVVEAVAKAIRAAGKEAGLEATTIAELVDRGIKRAAETVGLEGADLVRVTKTSKLDDGRETHAGMATEDRELEEPRFSQHQIAAMVEKRLSAKSDDTHERPKLNYRQPATLTVFPVRDEQEAETVASGGRRNFSTADYVEQPQTQSPAPTQTAPIQRIQAIGAGDFLYAVQLTRVNTDVPADVIVAIVVGGPFDGAKAIGRWTRNSEWGDTVGLVFNELHWKGKTIEDVELVAFHPETDLPGFATKVDRHYAQRFFGVALRAFGAGATAAITARRETQERLDEYGNVVGNVQGALDYELARDLFLARGAQELGTFGSRYENRPITIDVYNEQMKLLSLNNLYYPEDMVDEW